MVSGVSGRFTLLGIACGMGAGALWGLVFLAPELLRDFTPLELTIGRYIAYGAIAATLLLPRWPAVRHHLGRREWLALGWLALAGNTLYFLLLANAVQKGGVAMASLVVGFVPVAVTVIGSRDHGAVPLRRLAPSLLFCAAGAVCIGWQALAAPSAQPFTTQLVGLLCAVGALACWTAYAVGNSRWLVRLGNVSPYEWNLLTGVVTGSQSLLLIPVALAIGGAAHAVEAWGRFAAISVLVAVLASILGTSLWNRMSRLLPLTLVGQMIVFETLFALVYAFIWEERWPTATEAAAFAFVTLSILSCLAAHRRPPDALPPASLGVPA